MRNRQYDETFEHRGRTFGLGIHFDDVLGPPWKEHDGHGVVSEWTRRGKYPGERVLVEDRGSYRYYDFQETMKIAKRDGWGVADPQEGETKGQQIARAVERDFEHLRGWCNDQWHWVYVMVELLDSDGEPTGEYDTLGGIEDSDGRYIREVAAEMADEICDRVSDGEAGEIVESRPDMHAG